MNFIFDKIHDVTSGYGRLILPLPIVGWLMYNEKYGFRLIDQEFGFHNCRRFGD